MKNNLKIYAENVEEEALNQINTLMCVTSFGKEKVRIMPDCHAGAGCVIGLTSTMSDQVIPNIIGVDIGCGMRVAELGNIHVDLPALDCFIKENIPAGMEVADSVDMVAVDIMQKLYCGEKLKGTTRLKRSIGTLGGGNHFIEIDRGDNNLYLVVHSGSRNLGKQVAEYYQSLAIRERKTNSAAQRQEIANAIQSLKAQNRACEIPKTMEIIQHKYEKKMQNLPDALCYLEGEDMEHYMHDMRLCQQFAVYNRKRITENILDFLGINNCAIWESVHNYIDDENIIRKGAIAAHRGQKVIIPMNMRDGCIIGIGKGNADWNMSAPHGAGRIMSRGKARATLSVAEFQKEMQGIYTTTADQSTIDEAPMAYKPMSEILKYINETVDILEIVKPIYNFKADESNSIPFRDRKKRK